MFVVQWHLCHLACETFVQIATCTQIATRKQTPSSHVWISNLSFRACTSILQRYRLVNDYLMHGCTQAGLQGIHKFYDDSYTYTCVCIHILCLHVCTYVYVYTVIYVYVCLCLSIFLSTYMSHYPSICLSTYLPIYPSTYLYL